MKKLSIIAIILIGILLAWFFFFTNQKVGASQCNENNIENCPLPTEICDNGQSVGNPHCIMPTPTATPTPTVACDDDNDPQDEDEPFEHHCVTPTPTCTPTPSVTPLPSATPTATPTPEALQSPTPSPTPETTINPDIDQSTSVAGSSGVQGGSDNSSNSYTPTCNIPFDSPKLQGFTLDSEGNPTFSWWRSTDQGVTKQSIVFGYEKGNPLYGADNLNPNQTQITLRGLRHGKNIWAQIIAWKGDCPSFSNWFDPKL